MISNAIPGITNVNAYANTIPAKGIAASNEQTADFQKALINANTQKQSASVSTTVAKTLTATGAAANNVNATYEKSKAAQQLDTQSSQAQAAKQADTGDATKTVKAESDKTGRTGATDENTAGAQNVREETEVNGQLAVQTGEEQEGQTAEPAEETTDALQQAMLEESRQLMEQLADSLGVDIEDIETAMATLGLTNVSILDPSNLTQIIGQVTGANDIMAIVTNADLYLNVQNMQDAVDTTRQDLMQEFGLTEEGLSSALEDFEEMLSQQGANEEVVSAESLGTNLENTFPADAVRLDISEESAAIQSAGEANETNPEIITENTVKTGGYTNENAAAIAQEVIQEATDNVTATSDGTRDRAFDIAPEGSQMSEEIPDFKIEVNAESSENRQENNNQQNTDGSIYNQVMNQISSSLSEVVETESYGQMARANTEEIMNQITEYIKMNVKADTTTMELQLHPASLGNVNVIIEAAKDGNVIAKFLTQNEDVRAAIESQLQQLQDKLNEQGVKVTAVEVTVNSGAFDQALNDSQSQRDDDADAQNSIRKPMRRIRLGDLSPGELEEIDEEDKLTAEMMAINGNSVDFSA